MATYDDLYDDDLCDDNSELQVRRRDILKLNRIPWSKYSAATIKDIRDEAICYGDRVLAARARAALRRR